MDTPRSALRDRSNNDDFATTSLVRGSVGGQGEATKKPSLLAVGGTQSSDPPAAVPTVTPEPHPQPDANTSPPEGSAGALQARDGEATRVGDTCARREGTAHNGRRQGAATRRRSTRPNDRDPAATRPRRPPPPVACTLVAFEPGSLGLELEAIVDEEAKTAQRGDTHRDQRRGRRPRRLGCRVFRVTSGGQAARHGSVHPGDALVVLDG